MRQILIEEGYEDAKEYFICLSDVHPQCWDILGSQSDPCHHYGDKGTIPYYYLGVKGKINCLVSHPDVCYTMLSYWRGNGMGSGLQNYRGSGIPILSGACQFDVSTLDVVI